MWEYVRKQTEIYSWAQDAAYLPHFTIQSLNKINKGQLETGEMADTVPDLDHEFNFLFLSVSQRLNNHLQECGILQCVHLTWSCRDSVSAPIPANFVVLGIICCTAFLKKTKLRTLSSPGRLLAPLCCLHVGTGANFSTTLRADWEIGPGSFSFFVMKKRKNIRCGF